MKNLKSAIAFAIIIAPIILVAQDSTAYFNIPSRAKSVEIGLMSGLYAHSGYLYKLDSNAVDLLKIKYVNAMPSSYSNLKIPVQNINYIKIYRAKRSTLLGMSIGAGIGMLVGAVVLLNNEKSAACDNGDWYLGKGFECLNNTAQRVGIYTGIVAVGTITGGLIGTRVSIIIPINGNQVEFEASREQLEQFSILRN